MKVLLGLALMRQLYQEAVYGHKSAKQFTSASCEATLLSGHVIQISRQKIVPPPNTHSHRAFKRPSCQYTIRIWNPSDLQRITGSTFISNKDYNDILYSWVDVLSEILLCSVRVPLIPWNGHKTPYCPKRFRGPTWQHSSTPMKMPLFMCETYFQSNNCG